MDEENAPLSEEIRQGDVLERALDDGSSLESGSRLLNDGNHLFPSLEYTSISIYLVLQEIYVVGEREIYKV